MNLFALEPFPLPTEDLILKKLEGLAAAFNRHDVDAVLSFFAEDC